MRFQIPQFIEHEPKVIGPLTFRRAGYVGAPLVFIFFLYFMIAKDYFILFILLSIVLEGIGVVLAFVKIEGKSIPQLLMDATFFLIRPKMYIWKRGRVHLQLREMEYGNPDEKKDGKQKVRLVQKSRIMELGMKVQTKR